MNGILKSFSNCLILRSFLIVIFSSISTSAFGLCEYRLVQPEKRVDECGIGGFCVHVRPDVYEYACDVRNDGMDVNAPRKDGDSIVISKGGGGAKSGKVGIKKGDIIRYKNKKGVEAQCRVPEIDSAKAAWAASDYSNRHHSIDVNIDIDLLGGQPYEKAIGFGCRSAVDKINTALSDAGSLFKFHLWNIPNYRTPTINISIFRTNFLDQALGHKERLSIDLDKGLFDDYAHVEIELSDFPLSDFSSYDHLVCKSALLEAVGVVSEYPMPKEGSFSPEDAMPSTFSVGEMARQYFFDYTESTLDRFSQLDKDMAKYGPDPLTPCEQVALVSIFSKAKKRAY